MELLDRRTVLVCGGVTVPAPPFTERDLKLLVSDIELVQSHFNQSRAIIVADFEDKFSLIQEHFRRVFPAAEDRGMLPIVLVHSHSNFVQVSALRDKDHKQSSAEIFLISDAPKAAERIARHVPGPPVGNATIEPRGLLSDLADELLLRRAFSDCERIYLERLGGGKASIGVYRTHAWLKESQVGPRPLPFFVKIASPAEVAKEQQCYIDYAEHYIPFNLRPNLDRRRCVHARNRAALVGSFVDDAVPLRKSLRSGHGIGALFSLFETSLRGFRLQPFHKQDAPRSNVLKGFADYRIWTEGLAADIREQAISFGLTVSPEEMRAKVCQAAEPLKCWVAPYHGDLHAGNIMIRGSDAILIDFSSAANGPLTADPAALEVSLMFGTDSDDDPASFQQWRSFIDEMYVQPISSLHPPVFYDSTPGRFSWLGRSLRELRHVFLGCGCDCIEINLVLATYLMRFARLPLEDLPSKELEDLAYERHAYALVVAGRLTSDLPGGKS
jgi:hypothetical protein